MNDTTSFLAQVWLLVDTTANLGSRYEASLAVRYPLVAVAAASSNTPTFTAVNPLPANVNLLSLFVRDLNASNIGSPQFVVRLHNMVEAGDPVCVFCIAVVLVCMSAPARRCPAPAL